ncbi:MAG: sporulation YhaL family protein [Bacillaceae bacterium]|nr:sporulation YhaL family protein [Bacillaceae bacterium]
MGFEAPWWVLLIMALILFSGYQTFKAMRAERKLEQEFIEREGQIYMERIRREREKRKQEDPSKIDSAS